MLALVMLWVFSFAITPWNVVHDHSSVAEVAIEKNCTHQFHIKTQHETCLVCKAHFEKNYELPDLIAIPSVAQFAQNVVTYDVFHITLDVISSSLRGPPAA
ncbi:MAG: hypothetical protein EOO90_13505 [Pedobacter sp.]|nr:MAG: hypothetical protein EOO90_13505 [Pedobacter sp.]